MAARCASPSRRLAPQLRAVPGAARRRGAGRGAVDAGGRRHRFRSTVPTATPTSCRDPRSDRATATDHRRRGRPLGRRCVAPAPRTLVRRSRRARRGLLVVVRRHEDGGFDPVAATRGRARAAVRRRDPRSRCRRDRGGTAATARDRAGRRAAGRQPAVRLRAHPRPRRSSARSTPCRRRCRAPWRRRSTRSTRSPRRVLSYASVLGRSFRRNVLAEVLRRRGACSRRRDHRALRRFLESDGADRWRFRNGLLRDVDLRGPRIQPPHPVAPRGGRGDGADLVRLSRRHADTCRCTSRSGGDHERTCRYSLLAADRARRTYVNAEAAVQLERALDASRWLDASTRRAPTVAAELGELRDRGRPVRRARWTRTGGAAASPVPTRCSAPRRYLARSTRRAVARALDGTARSVEVPSIVEQVDSPRAAALDADAASFARGRDPEAGARRRGAAGRRGRRTRRGGGGATCAGTRLHRDLLVARDARP